MTNERRAAALGALSAVPLLVWWLGWFPGVVDGYGIDQLTQARTFSFTDTTPAFYALTGWIFGWGGHAPGLLALVQAAALAVLLVAAARRFTRLGVPWWLSGGAAVAVALLPAVGNVAVTLWNDTAAGLAAVWVFVEMLGLAADGRYLRSAARYRLAAALALWWLYGGGGGVGAVVVAGLLVAFIRSRAAYAVAATTAIAVAAVHLGAYTILPVERNSAHAAEILAPVVADAYRHHRDGFGSDDLRLMERLAPLEVWEDATCDDGSQLLDDRQFDLEGLQADDGAFRSLGWRTVIANPLHAAGYRLCASRLLWTPAHSGGYFDLPAYAIPPNRFDIQRDPISWWAFNATKAILVRTQQPDRLWLWWRPALPVWLAAAVYLVAFVRRRSLWPGAVVAGSAAAVLLTINGPGIRPVWALYLTGWLSVPLLWPALRPAPRRR